jgi:hypothetical protein
LRVGHAVALPNVLLPREVIRKGRHDPFLFPQRASFDIDAARKQHEAKHAFEQGVSESELAKEVLEPGKVTQEAEPDRKSQQNTELKRQKHQANALLQADVAVVHGVE